MTYTLNLLLVVVVGLGVMLTITQPVFAQLDGLRNPSVPGQLGGTSETNPNQTDPNAVTAVRSGSVITQYMVTIWRTVITLGGLILILYFIWGAVDWITAGESSKVSKARDKIVQAVIGMVLLGFSFVIIAFIGQALFGRDFSLLRLTFPTPDTTNSISPNPTSPRQIPQPPAPEPRDQFEPGPNTI